VYYLGSGAAGGLVDPSVHRLHQTVAIALSVSALVTAWILYDGLWRTIGDHNPRAATIVSVVLLFAAIFGFTQMFSGRAAYMQVGVLIGTLMTGNVWMVIVPSQHELVNATRTGRDQDPTLSIRAKHRSIHNNYLTFPLLFIMVSNHFGSATSHPLNWLVLICVMIGGAGVRHFMNVRYRGGGLELPRAAWLGPAIASGAFAIAGLLVVTRLGGGEPVAASGPVDIARVQEIVANRCATCHSARPSDDVFRAPPNNVMFDTPEQIQRWAVQIRKRVVEQQTMPLMNKTNMTPNERGALKRWIDDGARIATPPPRP
jgi:uncharacterized membrane protein